MDEVPVAAGDRPMPPKTPTCRCGCGRSWPSGSTSGDSTELFDTLEMPLIDVLVELEFNGIKVDVDAAGRAEPQVRRAAGSSWSARSTSWPAASSTSARPSSCSRCCSTSRSCRCSRRPRPAPAPTPTCWKSWPGCIRCRPRSSSIGSTPSSRARTSTRLPAMVHPETGRVHASFNQVVAATGRLSSSDPNLQNIPDPHRGGPRNSLGFCRATTGWKLLAADYSQIELRVLAHFSGDANAVRGLCPRRGHPRPRGQPGLRRAAGRR